MSDAINSISNNLATNRNALSGAANSSLGKDAFLQLLVAQMKYQDPMNPNSDTQFVSQLATFSQLEQMQNLNTAYTHSQAFSMVGKAVVLNGKNSSGNPVEIYGNVDFVTLINNVPHLSVNNNLYAITDLVTVFDKEFLEALGLPGVEQANLDYDKKDPKDVTINISMGHDGNKATEVKIKIGSKELDSSHYTISDGKIIIKKEALAEFEEGKHKVEFTFNDTSKTVVGDRVTITIKNSKEESETNNPSESGK